MYKHPDNCQVVERFPRAFISRGMYLLSELLYRLMGIEDVEDFKEDNPPVHWEV